MVLLIAVTLGMLIGFATGTFGAERDWSLGLTLLVAVSLDLVLVGPLLWWWTT